MSKSTSADPSEVSKLRQRKQSVNQDDLPSLTPSKTNGVSPSPADSKKQAFVTRTIWTFIMIFLFFVAVAMGHSLLIGLVLILQVLTFKEIIALTSEPARDKNIPYNRTLNWYFLVTSLYFLDSQSFVDVFQERIFASKVLTFLVVNHSLISYTLFIAGFVFFVWTLKKGYYKFQFAQLCITHMILLLVVVQLHLLIENIMSGIIWFLLPCALVIVNDIFAYLCGITFGKTQLIEISPKKTVEGFVGAWACTGVAALAFTYILSASDFLICPATDLSTNVFNYPLCEPNPVFLQQLFQLPANIQELLHMDSIAIAPVYFHAAALATFASLIAPFGGFFASGLKRAFGIKDFGDTIPGHGGVTDRMDCQFLMGLFSYLYYHAFVIPTTINIGFVLQMAIINLTVPQLLQLVKSLLRYLNNTNAISEPDLNAIFELLDN